MDPKQTDAVEEIIAQMARSSGGARRPWRFVACYDGFCLLTWSAVLLSAMLALKAGGLNDVFDASAKFAAVGQVARGLEMVLPHAWLRRRMKSPLFFGPQVIARLWILLAAALAREAAARTTKFAGLMILSWAVLEVLRYSFYVALRNFEKLPFLLWWVRYSAFYVLFPAVVVGEVFTALCTIYPDLYPALVDVYPALVAGEVSPCIVHHLNPGCKPFPDLPALLRQPALLGTWHWPLEMGLRFIVIVELTFMHIGFSKSVSDRRWVLRAIKPDSPWMRFLLFYLPVFQL